MGLVQCFNGLFDPLQSFIVARGLLIEAGVFLQVVLDLALELVAFGVQFAKRAGPFFGGVGGQFAAVDGKEFVAEQALFMANQ